MTFRFETTLGQYLNSVDKNFHEMIKTEIRKRLVENAKPIIEEAAEQMTKDLLLRLDHAVSPTDNAVDIRMTLRVGGEDKKFVIKKSVEQV